MFTNGDFHGRVPYNAIYFKFTKPLQSRNLPVEIQKLLIPVNEKYRQTQSNILEPYYDRKTQAAPLKVNDFTFLLNPTLSNQP